MIYTKIEDKKAIKKAFTMFLVEHDLTLLGFCKSFNYSYPAIYQKLTVNNISHDLVNEMIAKLDKTRALQKVNKTFVISRKF